MTQTYKEVIILKRPKIKKSKVQTLKIEEQEDQRPQENKVDNSEKYISNPRYFEEIYTLKKAKQKYYASDIYGF